MLQSKNHKTEIVGRIKSNLIFDVIFGVKKAKNANRLILVIFLAIFESSFEPSQSLSNLL